MQFGTRPIYLWCLAGRCGILGWNEKRHGRCFEKMVQVDLITGFLGAGKTTFLRRYVRYLVEQGHL